MQPIALDVTKAERAHAALRSAKAIPFDLLPAAIATSWNRCLGWGLDVDHRQEFDVVRRDLLLAERERNDCLLQHAAPVMSGLHAQIAQSDSMIVLTNADGFILHSVGDPAFLGRASRVALSPGVDWSESNKGTNAIGTALVEQQPVVVHGHQHFFSANHFLTCSASPIFGTCGQVLGVLDVTGDSRSPSRHSLALIDLATRTIENQMFNGAFPEGILLRFHAQPELLGTLFEGILVFDATGQVSAANRSACRQAAMSLAELRHHTFTSLFDRPLRALFDHTLTPAQAPLALRLCERFPVHGRAQAGMRVSAPARVFPGTPAPSPSSHVRAQIGATPQLGLDALRTGDPRMEAIATKLRLIRGHDIPLLIHGETGTGKELLAHAVHRDGTRGEGPFVAVNCASIPETLIESELFGYEEGAFTGARRKGYRGRIMQAQGGTLFLDEIGDMPLPQQARLLRVLQEREVVPLGSARSYTVDIALICATHGKLRDLVAAGRFRQDLYYRLNGLTLTLPALRERTDLHTLIDQLLTAHRPDGRTPSLSAAVLHLFEHHPWPGNVRQLRNVLRTATVMMGDADCIRMEHLPDDFLDEFNSAAARDFAPAPPLAENTLTRPRAMPEPSEPEALDTLALRAIRTTLRQHDGNVSAAARALRISRTTLYRKLKNA